MIGIMFTFRHEDVDQKRTLCPNSKTLVMRMVDVHDSAYEVPTLRCVECHMILMLHHTKLHKS